MQEKRDLLVLTTGGTLDAAPYEATPRHVRFDAQSRVAGTIETLRRDGKLSDALGAVRVVEICRKDSKDVNDADMRRMVAEIIDAPEAHIMITHGTDVMPENARAMKALLQEAQVTGKSVVFTGAMEPLSHGAGSDGMRNLADAVTAALHNARAGVSIVMHGMVLEPDRAVKDFERKTITER